MATSSEQLLVKCELAGIISDISCGFHLRQQCYVTGRETGKACRCFSTGHCEPPKRGEDPCDLDIRSP